MDGTEAAQSPREVRAAGGLVRTEPLVGIVLLSLVTAWVTPWRPALPTSLILAAIFVAFAGQLLSATLDNLRTAEPGGFRRPPAALGTAALVLPALLVLDSSYSLIFRNNFLSLAGLAVGVLLFWAGKISLWALRKAGKPGAEP